MVSGMVGLPLEEDEEPRLSLSRSPIDQLFKQLATPSNHSESAVELSRSKPSPPPRRVQYLRSETSSGHLESELYLHCQRRLRP